MADLLRVLVVARHPLRLDDLELDELSEVQAVELMRRPAALALAIEEFEPNVILVDTRFPENRGFAAIGQARALLPDLRILALTADPAPHDHVARATRAGASGFITADAEPREFADAVRTVHAGQPYLPSEETLAVLGSVAENLDVTAAERRSRLTGIVIGLIPLTAAMAAIISLLWRKYVGDIGVRPVDLAIDPGSRVVDAFAFVSLVIGVFGPLLFVASWLNLLRAASEDQPRLAWLGEHRTIGRIALSVGWLAVAAVLTVFSDIVLILFIGPLVMISLIARGVDLQDQLPTIVRVTGVRPARVIAGALVIALVFLTILSTEVLVKGPDLRTDGAHGILAPKVLGFKAQPMRAFAVDTCEPRETLYLGGNADLYVLVDPCNNDEVEYVSVGSTRLVVIDEVTCPTESG